VEPESMKVTIRRTSDSRWHVVFYLLRGDATLEGTLEVAMNHGSVLTEEEAENLVWANREELFRRALCEGTLN